MRVRHIASGEKGRYLWRGSTGSERLRDGRDLGTGWELSLALGRYVMRDSIVEHHSSVMHCSGGMHESSIGHHNSVLQRE
jgi:hypothetical protein